MLTHPVPESDGQQALEKADKNIVIKVPWGIVQISPYSCRDYLISQPLRFSHVSHGAGHAQGELVMGRKVSLACV